ncbi:MAG: hypothetical protein K6G26_03245 [Lachnospiraceae bacterium]|nr:hypothetical protein [Lachnospiraceae bacterium]
MRSIKLVILCGGILAGLLFTGCKKDTIKNNSSKNTNIESTKKNSEYRKEYETVLQNLGNNKNLSYEILDVYWNVDINDAASFDGFKGKFVEGEIIKETEEGLIAKLVFDIKNPAATAVNPGKNEMYICVAKVCKNFIHCLSDGTIDEGPYDTYGTVIIENPDTFEIEYEEIIDGEYSYDSLKCPVIYNRGFGFKNEEDRYAIKIYYDEEISIDLNQDGKKENLSFEVKKIENSDFQYDFDMCVNKGKDKEAICTCRNVNRFPDTYKEYYTICDLDKTDNYLDIIVYDMYDSKNISKVYRYDGNEIKLYCVVPAIVDKKELENGIEHCTTLFYEKESKDEENNYVWNYKCPVTLSNEGFNVKWTAYEKSEAITATEDLQLYKTIDGTEIVNIPKGTKITATKYKPVDINNLSSREIWVEYQYGFEKAYGKCDY